MVLTCAFFLQWLIMQSELPRPIPRNSGLWRTFRNVAQWRLTGGTVSGGSEGAQGALSTVFKYPIKMK